MIKAVLEDITKMDVDAIVNSANERLTPGAGVSGAIHKAAGKELAEKCKKYGKQEDGNSVITKGYNLKAKYVIHTVAPKYYLEQENREELLRNCYKTCLKLADENNCKSIAFPAIGIGIYKWPVDLGLSIAVGEVKKYLKDDNKNLETVYFACRNNEELAKKYQELIDTITV